MNGIRMFTRMPGVQRYARAIALRAFGYLENNGNSDLVTNGESYFVGAMLDYFRRAGTSSPEDPLHLIDVGAHVGDYSQMLLDKSAERGVSVHLHLFEPRRSSFGVLRQRFGDMACVTLNEQALSRDDENRTIFFDHEGSGLASLYQRNLKPYGIQLDQSETVTTGRLDDYIQEKALSHVHFLKIDVEGHEMAVLEGMGSHLDGGFVDFVQFEYGGADLDSGVTLMDLFDLFEGAGFRVAKLMRKGLEVRTYRPWMDNFAYANYVAVSRRVMDDSTEENRDSTAEHAESTEIQ